MVLNVLANTLAALKNAEMRNKKECLIYPTSKFVTNVLRVLQKYGYIGEFEIIEDGRGGKYRIQLLGRINNCGIIKPRLGRKYKELKYIESKYLPSRDIGIIVITTSQGVMSTKEAIEKKIGGIPVCYVY